MRVQPLCSATLPLAVFLSMLLAVCGGSDDTPATPAVSAAPTSTKATLATLETVNLHTNVLPYDYFKLVAGNSFNFGRMATLINQAHTQLPNALLLDNDDTIQDTTLSDYQAMMSPITCDQTLAIYEVMSAAKYDDSGIGNHGFDYGLPYLSRATSSTFNVDGLPDPTTQKKCADPAFPQMLANVVGVKTNAPLFQPYTIITKTVATTAPDGSTISVSVKVGIISFAPSTTTSQDKCWLDGKAYTIGIKKMAAKYISEMRTKGANLVVAISHGELNNSTHSPTMENSSWWLSTVPGTDATLIGHSYQLFSDAKSTVDQFNLSGVDKVVGIVNSMLTAIANYWGKYLGVIELGPTFNGMSWAMDKTRATMETRSIQNTDKMYIAADPTASTAIATEYQTTINYVKISVGSADFNMSTHLINMDDPDATEIVNQMQVDYVSAYIQANLSQYASSPMLSVSAPFKSSFGGGMDFTDIAAGPLAANNIADLYLYSGTVYMAKVAGPGIKNWLGTVAKCFDTIDPTQTTMQKLVSTFLSYNFDMFTTPNLMHKIDIIQPVGSHIKDPMYKGVALNSVAQSIVTANNYRASGGGNFPGLDDSRMIHVSPDANHGVLISYIKRIGSVKRVTNGLQHN